LGIFDETLKKMDLSPCRDGELLQSLLNNHSDKIFTYDGMEGGIQRNSDYDAQEDEFSGKKKHIKLKITCYVMIINMFTIYHPLKMGAFTIKQ
jgi:hypothetical protein